MGEFKTNVQNHMLIRLGGLCGILGSVLSLVMVFAATVISPWFRWDTNALSELGVGEVSLVFNSAVVIGGVLNFIFALGARKYLSERRVVRIGAALVMLSSVCLALVGIFTVAYHFAHAIVSLGYFVLAPTGFILIGLGTERDTIRTLSIVTGIAALLAILILPMIFLVVPFKVGFAVPEMIEALILAAWIVFMGVRLLRAPYGGNWIE
jgi:hypothetical membrane protein